MKQAFILCTGAKDGPSAPRLFKTSTDAVCALSAVLFEAGLPPLSEEKKEEMTKRIFSTMEETVEVFSDADGNAALAAIIMRVRTEGMDGITAGFVFEHAVRDIWDFKAGKYMGFHARAVDPDPGRAREHLAYILKKSDGGNASDSEGRTATWTGGTEDNPRLRQWAVSATFALPKEKPEDD